MRALTSGVGARCALRIISLNYLSEMALRQPNTPLVDQLQRSNRPRCSMNTKKTHRDRAISIFEKSKNKKFFILYPTHHKLIKIGWVLDKVHADTTSSFTSLCWDSFGEVITDTQTVTKHFYPQVLIIFCSIYGTSFARSSNSID